MLPRDEKKSFVEVRVFVADRNRKPVDLSLVNADLTLLPKEGKPLKRGLQLMMPDPAHGMPETEPVTTPEGHQIRLGVAEFARPFEVDKPAPGKPSVYFKGDVPAELAKPGTSATLHLRFPEGKQTVELKSLFRN